MEKALTELTKAEKKVAAKVLYQRWQSLRKVAAFLGTTKETVQDALDEPTPDELIQFATDFEQTIAEMKSVGITMVHQRLMELLPKERRIESVVKAGEFLEGKDKENTTVTQVNVQNVLSDAIASVTK